MARSFAEIAFTPAVRAFQTRMGSRIHYAALDTADGRGTHLTEREASFIAERDGFFQATVGETGWPYVQFRGGPAGFLKVLDPRTIGYADFRGNVQYISSGNLSHDGRVALILMDYAQRRRLKIWGRARLVDAHADAALIERLESRAYRAHIERAVVIDIEAFDWNCPQHITPRFTEAEIEAIMVTRRDELVRLRAENERLRALGNGPLALTISGVRQLTARVRAYTLRAADGGELPAIEAGAHLDLPVQLADGRTATRRYSIASDPTRRDEWEIAVLREDAGSGGSAAVHTLYAVGLRLHAALPGNDFRLHTDPRPAVLVAGGIGITPIRAMAHALRSSGRDFALHYAGRSRHDMAWADAVAQDFGPAVSLYPSDTGARLDVDALVRDAPADALFYVCGPARLIGAVEEAARRYGAVERVRTERFLAEHRRDDRPITLTLKRSGQRVVVAAEQTILEAAEAAGVGAPFACRAGTCRSCATKVLAGTPEHRDTALSEADRTKAGLMCICVSRAKTADLVLDL